MSTTTATMTSSLVFRAPHCLACIRRTSGLGYYLRFPSSQQTRGKKKVAKATTINVRLRSNIAGFGKKGSIVPVPPGTMRNTWFPKKMAEYQTHAQLKELGDVVIERDPTFNPRERKKFAQARREAHRGESLIAPEVQDTVTKPFEEVVSFEPEPTEAQTLSSAQAAIVIDNLIPSNLEFYRTPIPTQSAPLPPKKLSPSLASTSALAAAAAAAAIENAKQDAQKPIYGSISTADVAATMKAILSEDAEGAQVVLSPENISFMEDSNLEDKTRVKHLGSFTIDIRLGHSESESIRRTITIKAQQ